MVTFTIVEDTAAPTTTAYATSVVRYRTATLKYMVNDADPTKGTATVTIKIKNSAGKVREDHHLPPSRTSTTAQSARFRCTLAKGTYRFYVYATDASGNVQSKAGSARLTVK